MPLYRYRCSSCQTTTTRIVRIVDRDGQLCAENPYRSPTAGEDTRAIAFLDNAARPKVCEDTSICGTLLEREEISETASMPFGWRP